MSNFVHLHCHTGYSLLDSMIRIPELAEKVAEHKMSACAITDHGNLAGVVKFTEAMLKKGVKPILGEEFYIAPDSRFRNKYGKGEHRYSHLILLAKNEIGWKNLMALSTKAYTEGFSMKPRIDKALLREHHEGLICTSACIGGDVAIYLKGGLDFEGSAKVPYDPARAAENIAWYFNLFEDDFYLEVQSHDDAHDAIAEWYRARYPASQIVATADAHYLNAADCDTHDTLLCCGTYARKADPERWRFPTDQCWVKTEEEMWGRFLPVEIENTVRVAEKVDFELPLRKQFHMPMLPDDVAEGDSIAKFKRECWNGLGQRIWSAWGTVVDEHTAETEPFYPYVKRLEYEMAMFIKAEFVEYALLLWDLMRWCAERDILTGDGRGSGAGSLVLYSLGITNVDPIARDCPFERFLNPGRLERFAPPDVDLDFPQDRRQEVIEFLRQRYGEDQVCQIGTYGTLGPAQLIRKLQKPLDIDYGLMERMCKLIPDGESSIQGSGAAGNVSGMTLDDVYMKVPQFQQIVDQMGDLGKWLMHYGRGLAKLGTHSSKHASGICITNQPVANLLPLMMDAERERVMAQLDMFDVEALGVIKFDVLGIKTLTGLAYVRDMIRKHVDPEFDFAKVDLDDPEPYRLLHEGRTSGIFQAEGGGFGALLPQIKPSTVEHLCALTSLCRPGPKISGITDRYVRRARGEEEVTYKIPQLEPILKRNYGVMAYQEDIMAIAHQLAGFTLAEADDLRKIMGKKQRDKMPGQREKFLRGLEAHSGISPALGEELWAEIAAFAEYGFNRAHAMAYSYLTAKCTWAKWYYPAYFLAGAMSLEVQGDGKELPALLSDARHLGVTLLPPDINDGQEEYHAMDRKSIRVGLLGIRDVGEKAVEAILRERALNGPYKSKDDFRNRLPAKAVNVKVFTALQAAGAFDSLDGRTRLVTTERLIEEFNLFGFFLSGHPCNLMRDTWKAQDGEIVTLADVESEWEREAYYVQGRHGRTRKFGFQERTVCAVVTKFETKKSKRADGKIMLFMDIEDETGRSKMIINQTQLQKMGNPAIAKGSILKIRGRKADPDRFAGHFDALAIEPLLIAI